MVDGDDDSEDEKSSDDEDEDTPKKVLAWRFNLCQNVNELTHKI